MQIVFDNITPIRARKTDPSTSHDAAKRAERFADSHKGRILAALQNGPMTAKEISVATGLSVEQTARRLPEAQAQGLCEPTGGERDGFRVWRLI